MGIESDQVVYDYLSRVGDLAQATSLTAAERARLVSGLREAIDTRRGGAPPSGTSVRGEASAVKKILNGIGSPDEVVRRAVHNGVPRPSDGRAGRGGGEESYAGGGGPSVPAQSGPPPGERPGAGDGAAEGRWRFGDWAGTGSRAAGGAGTGAGTGAGGGGGGDGWTRSGPGVRPDLDGLPGWRADFEPDFLGVDVPGAGGAVPGRRDPEADPEAEDGDEAPPEAAVPLSKKRVAAGPPRRSLLRRLIGPPPPVMVPVQPAVVAVPRSRLPLVESLATLVLAASAVLGLWYVAAVGWLLAYTGRRIGRQAAHFAGLWLPLLVACGAGYWLYQQAHGQPAAHPLTDAQFQAATRSAISVGLRAAAGCSAAFLAWRISRRR